MVVIYHKDSKVGEMVAVTSNNSALTDTGSTAIRSPLLHTKVPWDTRLRTSCHNLHEKFTKLTGFVFKVLAYQSVLNLRLKCDCNRLRQILKGKIWPHRSCYNLWANLRQPAVAGIPANWKERGRFISTKENPNTLTISQCFKQGGRKCNGGILLGELLTRCCWIKRWCITTWHV